MSHEVAEMSTEDGTTVDVSIPVIFSTKTAYPLPPQKFLIPASWRQEHLSELINKSLSLDEHISFEFLVRGELLRTSLVEWCREKNLGTEETLEIEYIESVPPPTKAARIPQDDWVSAVSCHIPGHFVTASYDAQIRIFDSSEKCVHTISGHTAAVTAISLNSTLNDDSYLLASASHDMTARLTSISLGSEIDVSGVPIWSSQDLASLYLHTSPLSSVSFSSSGSHIITASWDRLIGLWSSSIPEEHEVSEEHEERRKRRKVGETNGKQDKSKRKAPLSVLKSHTDRVMKAIFQEDGKRAFSCGLDSTVRSWDVEGGICISTLTAAEKPFLDIALSHDGRIAFAASTDRTVMLYDTRSLSDVSSTITAPSIGIFRHPGTPSCIAPSQIHSYHIVTGAYDGIARLWDTRSTKVPITGMHVSDKEGNPEKGGKILSADWARGLVGIGGESGLEIWRVAERE